MISVDRLEQAPWPLVICDNTFQTPEHVDRNQPQNPNRQSVSSPCNDDGVPYPKLRDFSDREISCLNAVLELYLYIGGIYQGYERCWSISRQLRSFQMVVYLGRTWSSLWWVWLVGAHLHNIFDWQIGETDGFHERDRGGSLSLHIIPFFCEEARSRWSPSTRTLLCPKHCACNTRTEDFSYRELSADDGMQHHRQLFVYYAQHFHG